MASISIEEMVKEAVESIKDQMVTRGYRGSNELRNASQLVLRGKRGGRSYRVPGTKQRYTASAPGQAPADRTGMFRESWKPKTHISAFGGDGLTVISSIESRQRTDNKKYNLGEILEGGTGKMAPRPHQQKILDKAKPKVLRIYKEPYF